MLFAEEAAAAISANGHDQLYGYMWQTFVAAVVTVILGWLQARTNRTAAKAAEIARQGKEAVEQNTRVTTAYGADAKRQVAEVKDALEVSTTERSKKLEEVKQVAEKVAEITIAKLDKIDNAVSGQAVKVENNSENVRGLRKAMQDHGIECPPHKE